MFSHIGFERIIFYEYFSEGLRGQPRYGFKELPEAYIPKSETG